MQDFRPAGGDEPQLQNLITDGKLNKLPIIHTKANDILTDIYYAGKETLRIAYVGGEIIEM